MSLESILSDRSGSVCEMCAATENLSPYAVPASPSSDAEGHIMACSNCQTQFEHSDQVVPNHWRCLNDSMWSQVPAVQVMAWRMLNRLKGEGWPVDLLDMMYMEEETLAWAKASGDGESAEDTIIHKDSNGNVLETGDTVTLIKSLDVKGSSLTAKRGTPVRNIRLVHDNAEHIEGRVNGQQIVILTKFVKKINLIAPGFQV